MSQGFLDFVGTGNEAGEVILAAGLRSAADLGPGTAEGALPGSITYDATFGIDLVDVGNRVRYQGDFSAGVQADLLNAGHFTFNVSVPYLGIEYTGNTGAQRVFQASGGGANYYLQKQPGGNYNFLFRQATNPPTQPFVSHGNNEYTKTRVDVSWNNRYFDVYIDRVLAQRQPKSRALPANMWNLFYIGGATGNDSIVGARVSDLQVSTESINLPKSTIFQNVAIIGDSITRNGQYPADNLGIIGNLVDHFGDDTTVCNTLRRDRGNNIMIHRRLAENGHHLGLARVQFYGRGGCAVDGGGNTLQVRADVLTSRMTTGLAGQVVDWYGQRNTVTDCIIHCGTNDIANGPPSAGFKSSYQGVINSLLSAGVKRIVVCTFSRSDVTGTSQANVTTANDLIREVAAENAEVHLCDIHALFGGATPTAGWFTDGVHYNALGDEVAGKAMGDTLLQAGGVI